MKKWYRYFMLFREVYRFAERDGYWKGHTTNRFMLKYFLRHIGCPWRFLESVVLNTKGMNDMARSELAETCLETHHDGKPIGNFYQYLRSPADFRDAPRHQWDHPSIQLCDY